MPKFKYTATDTNGNIIKKRADSSSPVQLIRDLKRQGFIPVEIQQEDLKRGKRYSHQTITDFTSALCLMMKSGLTLNDSLIMSRKTQTNAKTQSLIASLNQSLEKGSSFHSALKENCSNLPPLYLGLIKIGERIGSLQEVLEQLKQYMEEQKKFRDMMIGSLIYPVFVLAVVVLATILAAIFVIPGIQTILQQFGSGSSELDNMIIKIDRFRVLTLILIPLLTILLLSALILRRISKSVAKLIDKAIIQIPFIKNLIKDQAIYNLMYSMELLTSSGIPLNEALNETVDVARNNEIKVNLLHIKEQILKGHKLSEAFLSSIFPNRVGQWIGFGESTGQVEQVFGQLKDFYKGIIEKRMKLFMTMIEPAMIILVGILILLFVLNIVLPILTLYGTVI